MYCGVITYMHVQRKRSRNENLQVHFTIIFRNIQW
jgi:hypothetical protein